MGAAPSNPEEVLVSIGLPIYNGAAHMRRALDSLLAQTHRNLEIVISDNASTDDTTAICREYMARDPRIVYSRNDVNIGGLRNFDKVVRLARGDYFMWAAHDDRWAPTFIEANLRNLLDHPELIASISRVRYLDNEREVFLSQVSRSDTRPLESSMQANIRLFVANHGMNSRFYSLFRKDVLLQSLPIPTYCGGDTAFVVRTLQFGNYGEIPQTLYARSVHGESSQQLRLLRGDGKSRVARFLPKWPYSRDVWSMKHVRRSGALASSLLTVNIAYTLMLWRALSVEFLKRFRSRLDATDGGA
jgi:glycosyltransferase involved in cell wall biosynthesis